MVTEAERALRVCRRAVVAARVASSEDNKEGLLGEYQTNDTQGIGNPARPAEEWQWWCTELADSCFIAA